MKTLKVALLGCGNVGSQVARILLDDADDLAARTGARLELAGIAVRNPDAPRDVELPRELFTTDAEALVEDADIVIELMGGLEPARTLILHAIGHGASVVTGNKALLAADGAALYEKADAAGVRSAYEAAVAGAIPILRPDPRQPLRRPDHPRAGHRQRHHQLHPGRHGLHRRRSSPTRWPRHSAWATPKPTPPPMSKGHDAAAKGAILASLAFHTTLRTGQCVLRGHHRRHRGGHRRRQGRRLCHQAAGHRRKAGGRRRRGRQRAGPPHAAAAHAPAGRRARRVQRCLRRGRKRRRADVLRPGRRRNPHGIGRDGRRRHRCPPPGPGRPVGVETATGHVPALPLEKVTTSYSIGLDVADAPGVLSAVARVFAENGVSIETMRQKMPQRRQPAPAAELRFVTHRAPRPPWRPPSRPSRAWTSSIQSHPSCG